tara:strand:- start:14080 stop:16815 length:2736 start_codon:yes stop_codon:yes gene_type:complete
MNDKLDPNNFFKFSLDLFQSNAMQALNQGFSVVVSAPTGSGKTVIGEYAIHRAISRKKKVFYTTPLKALSNQKLRDFREQFGYDNVGLMTGDFSVNREASVVVMTTEIFRNMLYSEINNNDNTLDDVEAVVLDECHYMNDSQRGTVWEESIIHCPFTIQIVALSATIANAGQLTDWIDKVHGPTKLVTTNFRPVPLLFNFCSAKGLHPLLNEDGTGINPNSKVWRSPKGQKRKSRINKPIQPKVPSIEFLIIKLAERSMLPAIYFIFSRKGCDKAVLQLGSVCLLNENEKKSIKSRYKLYTLNNPEARRNKFHVDALFRGIASHHAGLLPAWKEFIEDLFLNGLIKVIFATETLAAGINMPARSTIISSLSKRTESGHRLLLGSEFLQMAGRAGRRGIDSKGFVITVQTRFEGVREAAQLATTPAEPLVSQFTPSYGMVLNLLQRYDINKSKKLVEKSFGRYLASLDLVEDQESLENLKIQLSKLKNISVDISWEDFEDYEKKRGRLREERRLLKILQKQAAETLANELTLALRFANLGTLISLKVPQLKSRVTPAVLVEKIDGPGQFPLLLCLTDENLWILISCQSVVSLYAEISCLDLNILKYPKLTKIGESKFGDQNSQSIAIQISELANKYNMNTPQYDLAEEVKSQALFVSKLEEQLESQPAHRWNDRKKLKKHKRRIEDLEIEIIEKEQLLHDRSNKHWDTFLSLIEILTSFGCLEDLVPTEMGKTVAALRGDNELWLGLALMSGYLDDLKPSNLAGVFQAISIEFNRPDLWSSYRPPLKSRDALANLSSIRLSILRAQEKYKLNIPACSDSELVGLVDAWANGKEWGEIILNTSLDEGDVVRIFRRTIDLLSQIQHCELLGKQLKVNSRLALNSIDKFPVADNDLKEQSNKTNFKANPATERSD